MAAERRGSAAWRCTKGSTMPASDSKRKFFVVWYFLPDGTPYRGSVACGHELFDNDGTESVATWRDRDPRMHFLNMPDVPVETFTVLITDIDGRPLLVQQPR